MTHANRRFAIAVLGLVSLACEARAQDASAPAPSPATATAGRPVRAKVIDPERVRAAIETLRKGPDEDAVRELSLDGAAAFGPLADALSSDQPPAAWTRLSNVLTESVRTRFQDFESRVLKIVRERNKEITEAAARSKAAAEAGSEPVTVTTTTTPPDDTPIASLPDIIAALNQLESDVAQAGWAAASELAREGAARDEISMFARQRLLQAGFERMRAEMGGDDVATRELAVGRIAHLGPLAEPLVTAILASDDARAKEAAGRARDVAVARFTKDLSAETQAGRDFAADSLFGMGDLAKPALEKITREGTPDERYRASRLLRRISWSISDDLYRKTGRLLDGFEKLPWRERRMVAYELEKQGGPDALPTLRRILERDPSENVQAIAAESLARLGDPAGLGFLAKMGAKPLVQSPEVLVAIALDQGERYLKIKRYDKALVEYDRVLEIQPKNEIALYNLACAYALLGDKERALDYLRRSIEEGGYDDFDHMETDDDLRSLHDDPRYKKLMEQGRLKKQTESSEDH